MQPAAKLHARILYNSFGFLTPVGNPYKANGYLAVELLRTSGYVARVSFLDPGGDPGGV